MRIALFMSDLSGGGAETLVRHLRQGYEDRGHTAAVFYARGPSNGGPAVKRIGPSFGPIVAPGAIWKTLRTFRPDVVHSHIPWAGAQVGVEIRLLIGRPCSVYTVNSRPSSKNRLLRRVEAVATGLADAVVCVSGSWSGEVCGKRADVIPNGSPRVDDRSADVTGRFCWLGRFLRIKQPELFLQALEGTEHRALIAGDGPMVEMVGSLAAQNGNVELKGWAEDPIGLMKGSQAVVFTSVSEGLPMVALEAMSVGVPLVAPELPEFKVILPGGYPYLYPPGDVDALRAVLDEVAGNPDRSVSIGEALREHHAKHYSVEVMVERYLSLFQSLLGAPGRATEQY